jgi:hypothetical protein
MPLVRRLTGRRGSGKKLTEADLETIKQAVLDGHDHAETSLGSLWLAWPDFEDPTTWGARVVVFTDHDCVAEAILDLADVASNYPLGFGEAVRRNARLRRDLRVAGWSKEESQDFKMLVKHYERVATERKNVCRGPPCDCKSHPGLGRLFG